MKPEDHGRLETMAETERRREVIERHPFANGAAEEKTLCRIDAPDDYRRSVRFYLEVRLHGARVGAVCEGCKARSIRFAVDVAQDLEARGLLDETEECRQIADTLSADTLSKETGRIRPGG